MTATIADLGVAGDGMKAMGRVMGVLTPQVRGRADGGAVAAEVRRSSADVDHSGGGGPRMTVAVDVLGPVRLRVDGEERSVGGRRERLLLALLAATPGKHVSDDRLVDEPWGEAPPTG